MVKLVKGKGYWCPSCEQYKDSTCGGKCMDTKCIRERLN
jgi:hypothetical protein